MYTLNKFQEYLTRMKKNSNFLKLIAVMLVCIIFVQTSVCNIINSLNQLKTEVSGGVTTTYVYYTLRTLTSYFKISNKLIINTDILNAFAVYDLCFVNGYSFNQLV